MSISGYQLPCGLPPWTPASSSGQANQKINKTWNNIFNRFTRTNTDSVSKMVSICRLLANSPFTRELTPIALCGYPHVKLSIRDLSQISATAPIFQQYNYFRQNSEENVTFTFYFFSFASNFPCKIL